MSYHSRLPWTAESRNLRDHLGNFIAVFKDHRDAAVCAELVSQNAELLEKVDTLADRVADLEGELEQVKSELRV